MLSYQHIYHAGNPADVHKHASLCILLHRLTQKDKPLSYLETHAGRGVYDLSSKEALKTGEAARGFLKMAGSERTKDHPYFELEKRIEQEIGKNIPTDEYGLAKYALNEISQVNQQYTNLEEFLKIRGITKQESDAVYDLYDTLAELSRLVVGLDIKNSPNSKTDYNTEIANGLKNLGNKVCDFYELYTVAKELNGNDKSLISFKGAAEKLALEKSENIKENEKQM